MIANPGRVTRQTPPKVPAVTSSFTVDDQGAVNPPNTQLQIPYTSVFDTAPPPGVVDLVMTSAELGSNSGGGHIQIPAVKSVRTGCRIERDPFLYAYVA